MIILIGKKNYKNKWKLLNNLMNLAIDLGQFKEAENYFEEAIIMNSEAVIEDMTSIEINYSELLVKQGKVLKAESILLKAEEKFRNKLEGNEGIDMEEFNRLLIYQANLYMEIMDYQKAEKYYRESENLLEPLNDIDAQKVEVYSGLGLLYHQLGLSVRNQKEACQEYFSNALLYFNKAESVYNTLVFKNRYKYIPNKAKLLNSFGFF